VELQLATLLVVVCDAYFAGYTGVVIFPRNMDASILQQRLSTREYSPFRLFILETNGILLGADPEYVQEIARFKKVHTRISLKAGTPEAFTRKTGAIADSFELPFQGIQNLIKAGASFHVAAMSADSRIVDNHERQRLVRWTTLRKKWLVHIITRLNG
jgi:hypothetical protein